DAARRRSRARGAAAPAPGGVGRNARRAHRAARRADRCRGRRLGARRAAEGIAPPAGGGEAMSGVEALVVAFGLFLGYWVVAKLLGDKPASDAPEWHRTLQVPADASIEEIRAAYRSLMGQHQRRAQIERGCRCLPERHAGARSGRVSTLAALLFAGKFGKFLLSGGSMVLSVFAYALVYGWRYAAGFVGLIFVHEMGHFLAARKRELDVGLPTFIPFVGAWIELKE